MARYINTTHFFTISAMASSTFSVSNNFYFFWKIHSILENIIYTSECIQWNNILYFSITKKLFFEISVGAPPIMQALYQLLLLLVLHFKGLVILGLNDKTVCVLLFSICVFRKALYYKNCVPIRQVLSLDFWIELNKNYINWIDQVIINWVSAFHTQI